MQNVFQLMLSYTNKTTTDCIQFLSKICHFFSIHIHTKYFFHIHVFKAKFQFKQF